MEYCHGHDSPAPTPIPAPRTPLPVRPPTDRPQGMASFRLNREDATALATQLLRAFGEDHANPSLYELTHPRLTCAQRQLEGRCHQLRQVTSTTGELTIYPSQSPITLSKKESQLQSKKMDFSQEKSTKSQIF